MSISFSIQPFEKNRLFQKAATLLNKDGVISNKQKNRLCAKAGKMLLSGKSFTETKEALRKIASNKVVDRLEASMAIIAKECASSPISLVEEEAIKNLAAKLEPTLAAGAIRAEDIDILRMMVNIPEEEWAGEGFSENLLMTGIREKVDQQILHYCHNWLENPRGGLDDVMTQEEREKIYTVGVRSMKKFIANGKARGEEGLELPERDLLDFDRIIFDEIENAAVRCGNNWRTGRETSVAFVTVRGDTVVDEGILRLKIE